MNKKIEKNKINMVKKVKRMSRIEFSLKATVAFKSMKSYRRKSKYKKDYVEDYK